MRKALQLAAAAALAWHAWACGAEAFLDWYSGLEPPLAPVQRLALAGRAVAGLAAAALLAAA